MVSDDFVSDSSSAQVSVVNHVYKHTYPGISFSYLIMIIFIQGPSGARVPCGISRKGHISRVEFSAMEAGPHNIDVLFAGSRVHGSPFVCQAYDPNRVRITDVDRTAKKEREIGFVGTFV